MLLAYLPPTILDASLPHCSLMLSSAQALFAHWKYEQRCKIFQVCAYTLFSSLELQSALLDLHPCLQFRSLLVGRPRLVGREEEGKASKFSPAGRRVAQPSPSPVEPASRGGKGAPRPMKPNVEWTNATRSRSASAPQYLALSFLLSLKQGTTMTKLARCQVYDQPSLGRFER